MGCNESKSSIASGNTVTKNKKPAAADYPKKDEKEEDVVVQQGEEAKAEENKGQEGAAGVDVKEGMQEATMAAEVEKKDDTVKEKPEKLDEDVKKEKEPEPEPEPEKENGEPGLERNVGENEAANNEESSTKEAEPEKKLTQGKVGRFRQPTTTRTSTQHERNLPQNTITE